MSVTDGLREAFDSCTVMAGVENDFECVYIVKAAAMLYLDEIDAAFRKLAQTTAKCQTGELVRCGDCIHFERCPMRKGDGSGYCWQAKRREERNGDEG